MMDIGWVLSVMLAAFVMLAIFATLISFILWIICVIFKGQLTPAESRPRQSIALSSNRNETVDESNTSDRACHRMDLIQPTQQQEIVV